MIKIKRGLDLPIAGAPEQTIENGAAVKQVAILGTDYVGMKPTMTVKVGDQVKLGQVLFADKKIPKINYTSPAAGTVSAINRGAQRVLQSVVIEVAGDESIQLPSYDAEKLKDLGPQVITENLLLSGLWTAFKTRPFSKVPDPDTQPHSIFVTAIDTHPLAADPAVVIAQQEEAFIQGLQIIAQLTQGKLYVCAGDGFAMPKVKHARNLVQERFSGGHPAGLASTHIHLLDPVGVDKTVWVIGYQDVIAIGNTFVSGQLDVSRVIALGGPVITNPRLVKTRLGAATEAIVAGQVETNKTNVRVISGSVLGGRTAAGAEAFLGRYHNQISVIQEGDERQFMGWLSPGVNKFSFMNIYISTLTAYIRRNSKKLYDFTSTTNGSPRAMVPIGAFERVMPLDILPTQLLRALIIGDLESAQNLGCLELEEEDLALCTYVCSGKYEYGPILRNLLNRIEKEC